MIVDDTYEFSAPHFFDFIKEESENDWCKAELWFDYALAYAPSHRERGFRERPRKSPIRQQSLAFKEDSANSSMG
ncbi:hypothetical protein DVH24_001885 [Malus domestica]|uniref:Uncharacterized protein n=1 Tax=Malus domestica TaxID=3750 RepID=A0A498I8Q5_MALDO|nr:hypothetical protein DVH24_001885 [Malus domestica]